MKSNDQSLRCIVVEDEDPLRQWLCDRLGDFPEVEVVGSAGSVNAAFRLISNTQPDGLFLDIKLKGGDAFQLLERLRDNGVRIPPIVMTTGFDEYAIKTINEWNRYVKKYLMKPFVEDWENKLRASIDALLTAGTPKSGEDATGAGSAVADHIFVKSGNELKRIDFSELLWVEVAGGGAVYLVTEREAVKFDLTLTKTLDKLPGHFVQISREFAVNKDRILRVDKADRGVLIRYGEQEKFLGVGDTYYSKLLEALNQIK